MLFNSYIFIFCFFPICLAGYYIIVRFKKKTLAQLFLALMSFWFYAYFRISYLCIMLVSIGLNYIFHRLLSRRASKGTLILALTANLGLLFYFKYFDFFLTNINAAFNTSIPLRNIVLPLGISFFTFQQIGFIVDTYRGEVKDCGLIKYALFVSFFPQLIAGPIVSHEEMLGQFDNITVKKFDCGQFYKGLALFIMGLFKKMILADTLGAGVDYGYSNIELLGCADAFIVALSYVLQLYFDFSGYCDMARGIGWMLGIEIPVNFDSPYKATNIVDFWKRWHITLGRFFTRYVYIPLGGNRRGEARTYINILIVYILSGFWHGAGWSFIVWGLLHGLLYAATRYIQRRRRGTALEKRAPSKLSLVISRALMFLYFIFTCVFFRAKDLGQAFAMLKAVFSGGFGKLSLALAECFELNELWYVIKIFRLDGLSFSGYIVMFIMLAVSLVLSMCMPNAGEIARRTKGKPLSAVMLGIMFVWCIVSLSGVSTFLYFNF